ncbi:hypothetical protein Acsp04_05010 [Actinomadura sp. NBRC 104425]|uniref:hypothetical protein n=1 Tax=Actinomadura sp. NBRC 104425 TaxID=3032204 RepID=UPI0024A04871|nr:hypothetical protein [Actinomadura sp. NBRC 104425]GLZ10266.1 hypothetical protein Acsp04_05010 [Actinomadura sp. NBRC 104425]
MTPDKQNAPGVRTGGAQDERSGGRVVVPMVRRGRRNMRATWESARVKAHEHAAQRRRRVLAYADLADRLTAPPLCYARPEQWNGYVPPSTWGAVQSGDKSFRELPNDSPRRAALVELCAEALRREQETGNA